MTVAVIAALVPLCALDSTGGRFVSGCGCGGGGASGRAGGLTSSTGGGATGDAFVVGVGGLLSINAHASLV